MSKTKYTFFLVFVIYRHLIAVSSDRVSKADSAFSQNHASFRDCLTLNSYCVHLDLDILRE